MWSVGGKVTAAWKEDVRLPCETVGIPASTISWSHQGMSLPERSER